jgi:hypothetical protein
LLSSGLFGFTRQAYYQLQKYEYKCWAQFQIFLEMVPNKRSSLPGIGGPKLFNVIRMAMKKENIQIGRDAYSCKIARWNLSAKLEADRVVYALEIALCQLPENKGTNLIHHSHRGTQYCCDKYISKAQVFPYQY